MKEFADDNFKFVEYGRRFSKGVENIVGKGEIARNEQFLLFLRCFQKQLFGKGSNALFPIENNTIMWSLWFTETL